MILTILSAILSGKITLGDLLGIMPFDDPVVCLEVSVSCRVGWDNKLTRVPVRLTVKAFTMSSKAL